jgi:hypothetical protein
MRRLGVAGALLLASCAGAPKGNRAEDYLPLRESWKGTYRSGEKDPQSIEIRPASPRGKVWLIDLSRFYPGGQYGLLVTNEERGLLLHAVPLGASVAKLDPPQILLPRSLEEGTGWASTTMTRGAGDIDLRVAGQPRLEPVTVSGHDRRARRLEVEMKSRPSTQSWVFWLAPGEGIVRFEGGAGDHRGVWDLVEGRTTGG